MTKHQVSSECWAQIKAEYDRCIEYAEYPDRDRTELYGIGGTVERRIFYTYRAEGLGWVLDKLVEKRP